MKPTWIVAFALAIVSTAPAVFAQSLVDAARQEEARRATVRVPSKVYTNSNLSPAPEKPRVGPPETAPPAAVAAMATPANSSAAVTIVPEPAAEPAAEVLDEKEWRSRAATLRAQVAMATKGLAALAGASHEDPREQAMLDRIRKIRQTAMTRAEEAWQAFETQADAAKVPRAWIQ